MNPLVQVLLVLVIAWGVVLLGVVTGAAAYAGWRWRMDFVDLKRGLTGPHTRPVEVTNEAAMAQLMGMARNQDVILTTAWAQEKHEEGWTDEEIETFLEHRPEIELN